MSAIVTIIHVLICLILIIAVLLQSGKAADLAGAFGGAGSQTAFGPRGAATILSKVTTVCAILFMLTSMGLWILSAKGTKSVVSGEKPAPIEQPAAETKTDAGAAPAKSGQEEQPAASQTQSAATETKPQEPQKKDTVPEKK